MHPLVAAIISGFFISLSGTLPLGNLNLTALYIASKESLKKAVLFALGVALVEIIYLRVTLALMHLVIDNKNLFKGLQWVVIAFLFVLGISSLLAGLKKNKNAKNIMIENNINRFVLGAGMSAINPMQLPFWAGWAVYLLSTHWLTAENASYNIFTVGAGLGTLTALMLFILAGRRFSEFMTQHTRQVNIAMAMLFFIMAGYQLIRLLI